MLGYKVDVTEIPEEDAGEGVVVNHAANHDAFAGKKKAMPSFRILKVNKGDGRLRERLYTHTYNSKVAHFDILVL